MTTYRTYPALAAYIDRIGAEEINFRKFMIKVYHGDNYYHERCLIRLQEDGTITTTNKDFEPTEQEAVAIKAAMANAQFPISIHATEAQVKQLKRTLQSTSLLFEFYARPGGQVIMCQERAIIDGRKNYIPWSMWSDGQWRRMEPDCALPFWKPKLATDKKRIMIHEGAKTARMWDDLTRNKDKAAECAKHPWGKVLADYEHWGMIGGALAPHRTDYNELLRFKPTEVLYVCDNDHPGKTALKVVSRCYGHAIKGVMFDDRWPVAWDLADPFPDTAEFWGKAKNDEPLWLGPRLDKLIQPATWATEKVPPPKGEKGRPTTVISREFSEEWYHCITPEIFVHRDWPADVLNAQEFNNKVRPYSDADDTARLLKSDAASKTAILKYSPARKSGIFHDATGSRYINTHMPSPIEAKKGEGVKPWQDYLEHLCLDDGDRHELAKWVATLIAKPAVKMHYGLLMVSETQGIGKGTLGERILAPLVGHHNTSYPNEKEIVDGNFNYWAAHKRLAVVHEIYQGHSSKAYDTLKSIVTDRYMTVYKKYQAPYEMENWLHIMACSNSMRALKLSMDDRRWFVPKLTSKKKTQKYWNDFNYWLEQCDGLAAIKYWAEQFVRKHGHVATGDDAPWSSTKRALIEESYSTGQLLVAQFLDRLKLEKADQPIFVLDTDLVTLIKDFVHEGRNSDRLERPATVRKIAKAQGWHISEHRAQVREWGTLCSHARILAVSPEVASRLPSQLQAEGKKPEPVSQLAQAWFAN